MLKAEFKRLRERYEINQDILKERSKEIFDLQQELKKNTSHLSLILKDTREVQTDVCFKNEYFTTSVDQIM